MQPKKRINTSFALATILQRRIPPLNNLFKISLSTPVAPARVLAALSAATGDDDHHTTAITSQGPQVASLPAPGKVDW